MVFKTQEKQCVFVQVSQRGVCGQPSDHAGGAEHLQRRDAEADRGALQHPAVPRGGQQQAGQHQAAGGEQQKGSLGSWRDGVLNEMA